MAMGATIGIILGNLLGANKMEEAKRTNLKLCTFSTVLCIGVAIIFAGIAEFIPYLYNTTDSVRSLATGLMLISAFIMPFNGLVLCLYYTLRSGGKALMTFVFDSGFMWGVSVPLAFLLSYFTSIPILPLYFICQSVYLLKMTVGIILVKRGNWLKNIVDNK